MSDTNDLAGTVALVTGASSGIGEATARALAARGSHVAIVARRRDRLDALAMSIRSNYGSALVIEADITDDAAAQGAVERTVAEYGRLDTVVNNAGVMLLGPISDADPSEWRRMLDLNVTALMAVTHAALPHLKRAAADGPRRVADLVNVSSVAGRIARSGSGVYNASKFAVGAFSESLRQEVTREHVRVSLVEPGAVDTELISHNTDAVKATLAKRLGELEWLHASDIADGVTYIVTRPRHVSINELLIRPTEQDS
ncbi:MAG: SDR family NAD(P)-dependent oxidoreductase [Vulcanimicrobiaceae bacterium]